MKKLLILLFSILISFNSYGDSSDGTICIATDGKWRDGIIYYETKPFTGTHLCKYENGQNQVKGKVKDGKSDGKWTIWYENGQIMSEVNYKDDKLDGKWTSWYENGQIEAEENYKDGKLDGKWTLWHENGQIEREENWKDNIPDGNWTYWFENGQKKSEVNYKDGLGKMSRWYENGQKSSETNYKDGKLEGKWTSWYENGQIEGEGNYKDGKEDGKFTSWHDNGQIQSELNYKDGKAEGKYTFWFPDGRIWRLATSYYKDGKEISESEFYAEDEYQAQQFKFAEEKRIAEERITEEKRIAKERITEEKRIAEERITEERITEEKGIAEELLNKKLALIPPATELQKAQNFLSDIQDFVEKNPDEFDIFEIAMFTTNTKLISEGVADDEQLNTVEAFREFASTSSAFKEFEEKQQDARNQVELEKIDIVMNNIDKAIKRLQSFPEENLTSASLVSIDEKIKSLQYILNNPKSLAELENADKELTIFLDDLVAEAQRIADAKKADEELLNKVNTELSIIDQHINKLKTYVRENLSTLSPDLMPLILEKVSILKTTKNESSSDNKSEELKVLRKVNEEISKFMLDNNIATEEENYKDGKVTTWYENGQIMSEVNYKDGKEDGKVTTWHENGQKRLEGNYKDGKVDGKLTWWDENGQIEGEGNYKDGKEDGKFTSWDENGQINAELNYKDGKRVD